MRICSSCGEQIPDSGKKYCPFCGEKLEYAEIPIKRDPPVIEPIKPVPPIEPIKPNPIYDTDPDPEEEPEPMGRTGNIKGMPMLSTGEVCVRSYQCASMNAVNAYLTVTNKRVIFHSYSSPTSFTSKEISLESVSGISCLRGRNFSKKGMIFGALLGIAGIALLFNIVALGIILLAVAAFIIWLSINDTYSLKIYSSKADSSPIDLGQGATSLFGNKALLSVACSPTKDTYKMIHELGALIIELQTLGDHAIDKWKK